MGQVSPAWPQRSNKRDNRLTAAKAGLFNKSPSWAPRKLSSVRSPLFQRRGQAEAPATEFAATVASLPAGLDSVPASGEYTDSLPMGADSGLPDARHSVPPELGADSLPAPGEPSLRDTPTLSRVGRYELKGPLGFGGLGQVHEAWDPLLSRSVAVKTLHFEHEGAANTPLDALFLNEARAAAGLTHPHIVTVHDAGLSPQGVYIAMERLKGRDLRQALVQGWQPTPWQAAQLTRRIADALAYAHAKGVVHCDIKPANIFLDRRDRPKLLDFGIARIAHRNAPRGLEGLVMGSPHYLAPEQLQQGLPDARTDIYALGVVLYELLTARKAFHGDTLEQITAAVLSNHPAPAHEVRQGIPRALGLIASRAMAKEPAQRYSSAGEMAGELRRWSEKHSSTVAERSTSAHPDVKTATALAQGQGPSPRPARTAPGSSRMVQDTVPASPIKEGSGRDRQPRAAAHPAWTLGLAAALVLLGAGAAMVAIGALRQKPASPSVSPPTGASATSQTVPFAPAAPAAANPPALLNPQVPGAAANATEKAPRPPP
jgi:serine/threonine protein kinase